MSAMRKRDGRKSNHAGRPARQSRDRPPKSRPGTRRRTIKVTPLPHDDLRDGRMRLNRFLASSGLCSRRAADELIRSGQVTVNGEVTHELGTRIDPAVDDVRYDGKRVVPERPVYILFNKPAGVLCTNAADEERQRVIDFLPEIRGRLYTVGRLDADSEGLILVTNDGDFAQTVAHPSHGVAKTYAVLVRGRVTREDAEKARGGVWLAEGRTTGAQVRIERVGKDRTYLKVTLREGRNREIRRVFARLGYPVRSLKRVRIGRLTLHGLGAGRYRFLDAAEVQELLASARPGGSR
jgi:pseudouridine synthase